MADEDIERMIDAAIARARTRANIPTPTTAAEVSTGTQRSPGFLSAFADRFRRVVPQPVRDVTGKTVQTALSGERFMNLLSDVAGRTVPGFGRGRKSGTRIRESLEQIPGVGGVAGSAVDTLTSPLSLATVGFGGLAATALKGAGKAGRLAAPLLSPVLEGSLARRAIGEAGLAVGAGIGSEVAEATDADPFVTALLTAGGGLGGARAARRVTGKAARNVLAQTPEEIRANIKEAMESGDSVRKLTTAIKYADTVGKEGTRTSNIEALSKAESELFAEPDPLKRIGIARNVELQRVRTEAELLYSPGVSFTQEDATNLYRQIGSSGLNVTDMREAVDGLERLLTGQLDVAYKGRAKALNQNQSLLLERVFGPEFGEAIYGKIPTTLTDKALAVLGVPRAVMTSWDISMPYMQGWLLQTTPSWRKAWSPMMKALWSNETWARAKHEAVLANPDVNEVISRAMKHAEATGIEKPHLLYISPLERTASIVDREEVLTNALAEAFPGVKRSANAAITFLNTLRGDYAGTQVRRWREIGYEATDADMYALGEFINTATGRGNLPANRLIAHLNDVLFSPRKLYANFEIMSGKAYLRATPAVRKLIVKEMVKSFSVTAAGLALMATGVKALGGDAEVELDPRSSDFGKLRLGATRLSPWGGMQPIARYLAQIITGQVTTSTGEVRKAERLSTLGKFAQSKLAPSPGLLLDWLRGENFAGQEVDFNTAGGITEQAASRLLPLFIQDLYDAIQEGGLLTGIAAMPAATGVSVQTFNSVGQVRNAGAEDLYGKPYKELTGVEQAHVNEVYAERLAKQQPPNEASLGAQISKEADSLRADEQRFFEARTSGAISPREYTANMLDRNKERIDRVSGMIDASGSLPSTGEARQILSAYFELTELATVGGSVDFELLEQLRNDYRDGLDVRGKQIIDERTSFIHDKSADPWVAARKKIETAGYWKQQATAMTQVSGMIRALAPEVHTYRQLLAASRNPSITTGERARLNAIIKRVDKLTTQKRELARRKDPSLDAALVYVYGVKPIRGR